MEHIRNLENNRNLVSFFMNNFYTSEESSLTNLFSTTFRFSVDNGPQMDFCKYAKRKDNIQEHIQIEFDQPKTDDDINFTASFELVVPRVNRPVLCCEGFMRLLVVGNLIERVDVIYDLPGKGNLSILEAIKKIEKLSDSIKFV
ncbi:MAG: hypothetical protein HRU29_02370 [Rhizobiales bacterium]|nr:hypothetical protein [Hyphomicrobiales bacterium]NRB13223.1 hypothetical protein [Hyphomicrobiales bacterium]